MKFINLLILPAAVLTINVSSFSMNYYLDHINNSTPCNTGTNALYTNQQHSEKKITQSYCEKYISAEQNTNLEEECYYQIQDNDFLKQEDNSCNGLVHNTNKIPNFEKRDNIQNKLQNNTRVTVYNENNLSANIDDLENHIYYESDDDCESDDAVLQESIEQKNNNVSDILKLYEVKYLYNNSSLNVQDKGNEYYNKYMKEDNNSIEQVFNTHSSAIDQLNRIPVIQEYYNSITTNNKYLMQYKKDSTIYAKLKNISVYTGLSYCNKLNTTPVVHEYYYYNGNYNNVNNNINKFKKLKSKYIDADKYKQYYGRY